MPKKKYKEMGQKKIVIFDPIFKQKIHVLLNYDEVAYRKFLKSENATDESNTSATAANEDFAGFTTFMIDARGRREFIILVKEFEWKIQNQGTLIHEITHVIIRIFESNNIPFNKDTQEFIAHSIGNIYEMIARKIV